MALVSSGQLSMGTIADNRSSSSKSDISLQTYSEDFAGAGATVGNRTNLNAAPNSISEFYDAHYPNTYFDTVVAKLSTTDIMDNGYRDGETGRIYFDVNEDQAGTTNYTAGLKLKTDNSVVVSSTAGSSNPLRDLSADIHYATITIPDIAGANDKYYPFVSTGTYVNAVGGDINHYDQIAGGSAGLSYSSANVDAADESVSTVTVTPTVSTGTQTGYLLGNITSVTAGDGGTMTGTYGSGETANVATIANVPGKIRFAVTHYGGPSNARNTATSTTDLDITYSRAIDISVNDNTVNSGVAFTITAVSEGLTGAATMRVGYHTSNSGTSYTVTPSDKTISAATNYVRNSQSQAFTVTLSSGTSLATYYGKALYTSGAATITATSAIYIAPAFSYTATANATINVNQTQALGVSSVVGNNASVGITSSPDKGSGTNSATLTPGTNNRIYTISYAGTANYSQTSNISRTVTVNPTISLSLSDNQDGNNNPKLDADGNTIASSTHGISPTLFTATPTVVGDTVSYAWTTSGFTFTSGGGSTAGAVIFKKDAAGSANMTLTVSGNSTSANDAVSIVAQTIQKAITAGTKPSTLRAGVTFTVTSIAANYTQNIKLVRDGVVIGSAASIAGTMNFSISSTNDYTNNYDSNNVNTLLTDSDHTAFTFNLGTTVLLPPLPVIDNFSAATDDYLKKVDLSYDTTHATAVSINQGVGSQDVDDDITASGLDNDTEYTFTLTAGNASSEEVTDTATASTIDPAISFGTPGDTSITYGDTGTYTITITKNFKDAIEVHVGHGLNASEAGGTEWQILTSQGNGATSFDATFNRNFLGGSSFGSIIDYRAGSSGAGWFHNNTNNSFADFSTTGVPTSLASGTITGTAIQMTWAYSAGAQTGVQINYGETSPSDFLSTVNITNGATALDITDLDVGTEYQFRIRTYTTKTTTPLGSAESRTNYSSYSSTVNASTIGWNSIILEGDAFSGTTSGTGFATPEAAHLSDDVRVTLYYLNSQTLGSDTVELKRAVDGAAWDGNNAWFGVGAAADRTGVVYVSNNTGQITAANYHVVANTPPIAPTSIGFTSVTDTQIVIGWTDNSAIEDGFKIYMNTGGAADSGDTLINTASANATSYTKTGLSESTTYYFAVYAYRGSSLSSVLQGSQATAAGRTLATNDSASALDLWANETDAYKYSDAFVLTLANAVSNDQLLVTITRSGDALTDVVTKLAMNKDNGNAPYNSNGATPDGTGVQETSTVGGSGLTLTFSSLDSGTNYFTGMIEGLSDDNIQAGGIETATFTITAVVKNSGSSTVVASATYHTYQQKFNPFA